MRGWLIRVLGGYASLDEAIEAMRQDKNAEHRRKVLTLAVRRLYNTIGPEDILKTDKASGQLTWQGRPVSKEEMQVLIEQAKNMLQSRLWKVLEADIKYTANRRMFVESVSVDDITAGKLVTYYADIIHTRLKNLAGLSL